MNTPSWMTFGESLKDFRKQKRLTQRLLAARLGVHYNTIWAWERGDYLPETRGLVLELARHLTLNADETLQLLESSLLALPPLWNVPYQRNPWFTGREPLLTLLHEALSPSKNAPFPRSYALSGLGGIGKTQTAVEYAYRYFQEYTATFWLHAESYESFVASLASIATTLQIARETHREPEKIIAAVSSWFRNHQGWLLIVDNVEDIAMVKSFLSSIRHGSFLFTTRLHAFSDLAQKISISLLNVEDSAAFLIRRLTHATPPPLPPEETQAVLALAMAIDGLPLALDQAASYIEQTQCSVIDFLRLFENFPGVLLAERTTYAEHPISVEKTFVLSFERLQADNPASALLLIACCFLAPDAIPEALLTQSAPHLGTLLGSQLTNPLAFNLLVKDLLAYSLIQRDSHSRMLTVHRLVQSVLKAHLPKTQQQEWLERSIRILNLHFPPEILSIEQWTWSEQLLPHAIQVIQLSNSIEDIPLIFTQLLSKTVNYILNLARYQDAQTLCLTVLETQAKREQPLALFIAGALTCLARVQHRQGLYEEASSSYRQALSIIQQEQAADARPLLASASQGLGNFYVDACKYTEAEQLFLQALLLWEQVEGPASAEVASVLNCLGNLCLYQGKYSRARTFYQKALSIWEQVGGRDNLSLRSPIINLASLDALQGRYSEAETLALQVQQIESQFFPAQHPNQAYTTSVLSNIYYKQGRYLEAEKAALQALHIWEQSLGPDHLFLTEPLNTLALLKSEQENFEEAEALFLRALHLWENADAADHPSTALHLDGLGRLYARLSRLKEAEQLFQRAIHVREVVAGMLHPELVYPLHHLAELFRKQARLTEAEAYFQRALSIWEQHQEPQHPERRRYQESYLALY